MNKYLILILGILVLQSCDDGDVVVSDFNFDEQSSLNVCDLGNDRRILHIVTESNEAISLTFQKNIIENITDVLNPGTFSVPITTTNLLNYRRLDGFINSNDYFCQNLPPSEPNITEEFQSTSGGNVEFTITRVSGENVDTDGDGIPDNEERQVILADMHDDGVHFNRELLAKQKKMRAQKAKRKAKNTPMAVFTPNCLTGTILAVSKVKKPMDVVTDVNKVATPMCLNATFTASTLVRPLRNSSR